MLGRREYLGLFILPGLSVSQTITIKRTHPGEKEREEEVEPNDRNIKAASSKSCLREREIVVRRSQGWPKTESRRSPIKNRAFVG